jgi:hypothetical protein
MLRVNSAGESDQFPVLSWTVTGFENLPVSLGMITNADTGVLLTIGADTALYTATVTGTSVALSKGLTSWISPMLQAQDGSFFGIAYGDQGNSMVSFDASGNVRWSVPNETPQIATADGGAIAASGNAYDQNGSVTGQSSSQIQSCTLNAYQNGQGSLQRVMAEPVDFAFTYAAFIQANPSGSGTAVRPRTLPQEALYILAKTNLTSRPQCDAVLSQLAIIANVPEATLVKQIQATANGARDYVHDGPSSNTILDPLKFSGVASPGIATVGQWFGSIPTAEGLSQYNGYAVWFRLGDWATWWNFPPYFSNFRDIRTGKANAYAMGTVMHEVLHKRGIAGGFSHDQMTAALNAVGTFPYYSNSNFDSSGLAYFCFGNLPQRLKDMKVALR